MLSNKTQKNISPEIGKQLEDWFRKNKKAESEIILSVHKRLEHEDVDSFVNIIHLNRLNSSPERRESKTVLIERLKNLTTSIPEANVFENLYSLIYETVNTPKIKYVGHVAMYDITLRFGCSFIQPAVMPKDYVYLHGPVMDAFEFLFPEMQNSIVKHPADGHPMIPTSLLQPLFSGMTCSEIEDLFCNVGKCIKSLKSGVVSSRNNDDLIYIIKSIYYKI